MVGRQGRQIDFANTNEVAQFFTKHKDWGHAAECFVSYQKVHILGCSWVPMNADRKSTDQGMRDAEFCINQDRGGDDVGQLLQGVLTHCPDKICVPSGRGINTGSRRTGRRCLTCSRKRASSSGGTCKHTLDSGLDERSSGLAREGMMRKSLRCGQGDSSTGAAIKTSYSACMSRNHFAGTSK
jgi:hypothetical protein